MATTVDINKIIEEPIKSRFNLLDGNRSTVLKRTRDCALLTVPSILPKDGHTENDFMDTPYQSLGARLVNNLASKLLLTMLPPNTSFFRLFPDNTTKAVLDENQLQEANNIAVAIEKEGQKAIEKQSIRVTSFELMKSLIVTGNALGVKTEKGLKSYRLDNYVILRDYSGNVVEVITKETINPNTLDIVIQEQLEVTEENEKDVELYTRAVMRDGTWYEYQYVGDVFVEGSEGTYKDDKFPYLPLRWNGINGHNYGVGLVEQYIGDFRSLEACYQMLIEHAAVAGKTIFGIKPASILDIDELANAQNGDVITGDFESDLTVLRVDKGSDIGYIQQVAEVLQRRLEQAFLSASSVARESERTTAREISYMAADLEQALGGVYSVLSQEFQAPLAKLILNSLKSVDMAGFEFVVVTGVDALGRNSELEKLMQFVQILNNSGLTEAIQARLNVDNLINDITTASSLPTGRYVKSEQQVQQEQSAAQEQQLLAQGGQALAQSAGQGLGQQMAGMQPQ